MRQFCSRTYRSLHYPSYLKSFILWFWWTYGPSPSQRSPCIWTCRRTPKGLSGCQWTLSHLGFEKSCRFEMTEFWLSSLIPPWFMSIKSLFFSIIYRINWYLWRIDQSMIFNPLSFFRYSGFSARSRTGSFAAKVVGHTFHYVMEISHIWQH